MAQIFPSSMNTVARASILGGGLVAGLLYAALAFGYWGPFVTKRGMPIRQDVPFSHSHHVAGLGIDCRFCHTSVEDGKFAGIPPTETCMTCHSQIWNEAPMLQPVRDSFETGEPLEWIRVNDLPDFVYFNHAIHVNKGIGCVTCHGQVDEMPLMKKAETLHMAWCLQCHKAPEKFIRPKEEVFNLDWKPVGESQAELGARLVDEYGIKKNQLTNCSVCHR